MVKKNHHLITLGTIIVSDVESSKKEFCAKIEITSEQERPEHRTGLEAPEISQTISDDFGLPRTDFSTASYWTCRSPNSSESLSLPIRFTHRLRH